MKGCHSLLVYGDQGNSRLFDLLSRSKVRALFTFLRISRCSTAAGRDFGISIRGADNGQYS